jgi:hypothetical protein
MISAAKYFGVSYKTIGRYLDKIAFIIVTLLNRILMIINILLITI